MIWIDSISGEEIKERKGKERKIEISIKQSCLLMNSARLLKAPLSVKAERKKSWRAMKLFGPIQKAERG